MNVNIFIALSSVVLVLIVAFLGAANVLSIVLRIFNYHRLAERLQIRLAGFVSLFRLGIR